MKKAMLLCLVLCLPTVLLSSCGDSRFYETSNETFGIELNPPTYSINDTKNSLDEAYFAYHGRYYKDKEALWMSFSNAGFEVTFYGKVLEGSFYATAADSDLNRPYLAVAIDNDLNPDDMKAVRLTSSGTYSNATTTKNGYTLHPHVILASFENEGKHTIRVYKRSECQNSQVGVISLSTDGTILPVEKKSLDLKIEVFGDSVTCGYAVESDDYYEKFSTRTENSTKSYANYAANYLNADVSLVSAGGYGLYKSAYTENLKPDNVAEMFSLADFTYDTNDSNRHSWDNSKYVPDVVVVALGANDASKLATYSKGSDDYNSFLSIYKEKYVDFLSLIKTTYPDCVIISSSEIIPFSDDIVLKTDEAVEEYNASKGNVVTRFKDDAYTTSKDKTTPGAGHPNQEMQKIAGRELANCIDDVLSI